MLRHRPQLSFRFLPFPTFLRCGSGLRIGRGARTRIPEGTRIVGETIPAFPPRRVAHSITSSALACRASGTVTPSALAVLRLMTNSNFAGCCTGNSAGGSPFKMRLT